MKTDNTALGFFDGVLDEVRIWNVARTQAQIVSAINTKLPDPQTGLVGRWGLDEATGTTVNDSSGNAINGTITGTGSSWVAGAPFNTTVNLAPEAPVLVTPANGASNVPTDYHALGHSHRPRGSTARRHLLWASTSGGGGTRLHASSPSPTPSFTPPPIHPFITPR